MAGVALCTTVQMFPISESIWVGFVAGGKSAFGERLNPLLPHLPRSFSSDRVRHSIRVANFPLELFSFSPLLFLPL